MEPRTGRSPVRPIQPNAGPSERPPPLERQKIVPGIASAECRVDHVLASNLDAPTEAVPGADLPAPHVVIPAVECTGRASQVAKMNRVEAYSREQARTEARPCFEVVRHVPRIRLRTKGLPTI